MEEPFLGLNNLDENVIWHEKGVGNVAETHILNQYKETVWRREGELTYSERLPDTVNWAKFFTFSLTTCIPRSSDAFNSRTLNRKSSGLCQNENKIGGIIKHINNPGLNHI